MAPVQGNVEALPSLPEDAIFEILTRTSLESLSVCRCVSRQWCQMTYETAFASLHRHRTQTISGYFVQCMRRNRYLSSFVSIHPLPPSAPPPSLDFLPKPVKIEAAAPRGILLCTTQDYGIIPRYYVCKPATRQWCYIPNPKTRYRTEGIAMVASRTGHLKYKIIRFSQPKRQNYDLRCEIFDSRTKAWRQSNDIQLPPCTLLSLDPAVSVNGAVHWLAHDRSSIFSFNVCYESWKLIPLPERVAKDEKYWWRAKRLVKRENRLCLLLVDSEEKWLEIWTLAGCKDQKWERREVVSLEVLYKKDRTCFVEDLYSSSVGLARGWNRVIWHEFCTQKLKMVDTSYANHLPEFFRLESDMVPAKLTDEVPSLRGKT